MSEVASIEAKRDAYLAFLRSKIPQAVQAGFEPPSPCHGSLYPHQRDICEWACRGGQRAVFANFGLGKSRMDIQLGIWVTQQTGGRYLIVAPLGVRQEFTLSDGPAMGVEIQYVRTSAEILAATSKILITNYERVRDGDIDLSLFAGASLDEASVLRSFGSKTYQEFLTKFQVVPYLFVFTATPSPNRYKELIHYAGFLGIMDTGEALTRFFQRDSSQAGNLTLYPHMEAQFWMWLHSWAVFITKPSDLGYDDTGYDLPPMQVHWHCVPTDHRKAWTQVDSWGQAQLLRDDAQGLKAAAGMKNESIELRVSKALEIMDDECPEAHWLLWHDLEAERESIERRVADAVTVFGNQDLDIREGRIMAFSRGEYRVLATKPVIAGSGCNFQRHCSRAVFLGVGYKFNDLIQAVHRIHRFQQGETVHIHIIYLDSEQAIKDELQAKWRRHDELMARMSEILRTHRLSTSTTMELIRTLGCERAEVRGQRYSVIRNDCVLELQQTEANTVDLICTSIPFGTQYEYSPSLNDFGHNKDNSEFFIQMEFLCPELLRVLKPGRIAAIHVKDRIRFGNVTGHGCPTVDPFSDHTTKAFTAAGFVLMARITIDTDVVRENNQTYRLGWSENAKDGTKMGAGMPEYVLVFRKLPTDRSKSYADDRVSKFKGNEIVCDTCNRTSPAKERGDESFVCPNCGGESFAAPSGAYLRADWQIDAAGLWRDSGDRLLDPDILMGMNMREIKKWWIKRCLSGGYSHAEHLELAKALDLRGKLPSSFMLFPPISRNADVWTDIARMRTLNTEQAWKGEEKHVCPLQYGIIDRLITRYTKREEVVCDPFNGIGSVTYRALKMGRKAIGIELNEEYWRYSAGYCEAAEAELTVPTLFDFAQFASGTEAVA